MNRYEHLNLPEFQDSFERKKKGFGKYTLPEGRSKKDFFKKQEENINKLSKRLTKLKDKYKDKIDPNLIFELQINQSVDVNSFEQELNRMNIKILSVTEKKGYWIVFSDDEELKEFKRKLKVYAKEGEKEHYKFFHAIESLEDIPIEKKIGRSLIENPLTDGKPEYLNVEIWRMEDNKLNNFISQLYYAFSDNNFRITDKLITKDFALLRVWINKATFDEIINFKEIAFIDRPSIPKFNPSNYYNLDIKNFKIEGPDKNSCGILIIDSGIVSGHPLLEKAVGDDQNFQDREKGHQDVAGHGTAVAGMALYGDIEKCVEEKEFKAKNWIFSAKVMYAKQDVWGKSYAIYDPEKLVENQFIEATEYFLENKENNIKVVNISLGNSDEIWKNPYNRQFPLAALIDELALRYPDVVFVVSSGNQNPQNIYDSVEEIVENYPQYLIDNPEFNLINPATSAMSLTVGAIASPHRIQRSDFANGNIFTPIAEENMPAPFTRKGPSINNMIKPELCEYGGNLVLKRIANRIVEDNGGKLLILSNKYPGRLFAFDYGTSFSAPKVARKIGILANKYPHKNSNFLKNLILQSSNYPSVNNNYGWKESDFKKILLNTEGYGIPDDLKALYSFDNRVLLFNEGEIGLNRVKLFPIEIPGLFFEEKGNKKISIVLTYNPPFRATRGDSYFGNILYFKLFSDVGETEILSKFAKLDESELEETPEELKGKEIKYFPGINTLKNSCHQKAWVEYKRRPSEIPGKISLVLISQNRWNPDENFKQKYCISVVFEHEKEIDLYNKIREVIQIRERARIR